jgi:hypothetical protein
MDDRERNALNRKKQEKNLRGKKKKKKRKKNTRLSFLSGDFFLFRNNDNNKTKIVSFMLNKIIFHIESE